MNELWIDSKGFENKVQSKLQYNLHLIEIEIEIETEPVIAVRKNGARFWEEVSFDHG